MRNGIFGLFSLDGGPIDAKDRTIVLGALAAEAVAVPGALVAACDHATGAVHVDRRDRDLVVLLGDLDEPQALAVQLGMPGEMNHAVLAAAAYRRWSRGTPSHLGGEWLLLCWHEPSATLTLLMAEGAHEHCHVATDGRRIAISPELVRLARLPWVDGDFDPDMLMRTMGRAHLRLSIGARTILKDVVRLRAGNCITVDTRGVRVEMQDPPTPPPLVRIGFDDAIAELDALLRRIVRARLARSHGIAVEVSGGLDSSLLAVLAAQERPSGQSLVFVTSVAPVGSGLEDESDWAAIVARHLGVPMVPVTPAANADIYRPSTRTFAISETPALSPRHYLYEALGDAAVDAGAQLLVEGTFGELTISNYGDGLHAWQRPSPRALARNFRDGWRNRFNPTRTEDYHVRAAPEAIAALAGLRKLRPLTYAPRRLTADAAFGFEPGYERMGQLPTSTNDARLRTLLPFRDPRLIRLMASFPAGIVRRDGTRRAPIRALLRGHVPQSVVMRPRGLAFSPNYYLMLRDQAGAAMARLSDQRRAGAGEWLDLDWLERTLRRMQGGENLSPETIIHMQGTACAAAFFDWWDTASRRTE